jgi:3-oxoacyl-[acyl-carrier-protein] synthase II
MNARRVAITGVGAVSAAGVGATALADLVLDGRSGVHAAAALDGLPAGTAPVLPPDRRTRRLDRAARFFAAAADEAWMDAGLAAEPADGDRYAVIEGSSLGPLGDLLSEHQEFVERGDGRPPSPLTLIRYTPGAGGSLLAHEHRVHGPVFYLSAGSVSAMLAIGEAYAKVASGAVDVALTGGAECPLQRDIAAAFLASGILARDNGVPAACRPFDRHRTGTVLGEGAGALVLESEAHARARGARVLALVSGFAMACETTSATAPDPEGTGVAAAAGQALQAAGVRSIGWVKTHGTGTKLNDAAECRGLARLLGPRFAEVPLTSLKGAVGHAMGASGGIETVAVVLALGRGLVPPSFGTEDVDPELGPCRIALHAERSATGSVLVLGEGFGGRCAALVIERN